MTMNPESKVDVPIAVSDAAKKALKWKDEGRRGGTPVGMNTASELASGKVPAFRMEHISRYFPRHKGDNLSQVDPPSPGRVAWDLWGGDPAVDWTREYLESLTDEQRTALKAKLIEKRRAFREKQEAKGVDFTRYGYKKMSSLASFVRAIL